MVPPGRRALAAGLPRRVEGARMPAPPWLTADPVPDLQPPGVGSIETPPGWHGLRYAALSGMDPQQGAPLHRLIYLIIIGGLC